jgi:hypothetical protein
VNLKNKFIKHERFIDVAFLVYEVDQWKESLVIKGMWINQGQVNAYTIKYDQIQIMNNDIKHWSYTDDKVPRTANWYLINV